MTQISWLLLTLSLFLVELEISAISWTSLLLHLVQALGWVSHLVGIKFFILGVVQTDFFSLLAILLAQGVRNIFVIKLEFDIRKAFRIVAYSVSLGLGHWLFKHTSDKITNPLKNLLNGALVFFLSLTLSRHLFMKLEWRWIYGCLRVGVLSIDEEQLRLSFSS